jgi:hypothetical protein
MKIEIDLDVYKALTLRLEHEKQTLNDVLREMLDLHSIVEPIDFAEESRQAAPESVALASQVAANSLVYQPGFSSRGLFLPNGTALRARYKGQEFRARIENSLWIDHENNRQHSPTAAAKVITGNSVNGWRFWEAWRPGDEKWRRLDLLS